MVVVVVEEVEDPTLTSREETGRVPTGLCFNAYKTWLSTSSLCVTDPLTFISSALAVT